jgi:copper chaperone CopZ
VEESQFSISNMACSACEQRIEQYLRNLRGVFSVKTTIETHSVLVKHNRYVQRRELVRALIRIGYPEI